AGRSCLEVRQLPCEHLPFRLLRRQRPCVVGVAGPADSWVADDAERRRGGSASLNHAGGLGRGSSPGVWGSRQRRHPRRGLVRSCRPPETLTASSASSSASSCRLLLPRAAAFLLSPASRCCRLR